jgi:hypothetical protein
MKTYNVYRNYEFGNEAVKDGFKWAGAFFGGF